MKPTLCRAPATITGLLIVAACTDAAPAPREPAGALRATPVVIGGQLANVPIADLGTLPGFYHHTAAAVNESGWVVGTAEAQTGIARRAFVWKSGVGIADLGAAPGYAFSTASGINASGDVAGYSSMDNDQTPRATLWRAGAAVSLGNLNPAGPLGVRQQRQRDQRRWCRRWCIGIGTQ